MPKLTTLEVENFKRLRAVTLNLGEHVTEISGKNGAGKSSAIDAVSVLLEGLENAPAVPIRLGCESSVIRGTLGDLIVERTFYFKSDGKTTSSITLRTPEGARFPSPQKHLDELIGKHKLDPLDFINASPKEQFDILRQFVPGVDFEAIEKAHKADFERRTEINRFAKQERAAADTIVIPADTPTEPINESALVQELETAGTQNTQLEQRKARRAAILRDIEAKRVSVAGAKLRCDELLAEIQRIRDEALRTDAEADELQAKLDAAEALPDPIDTTVIRAKIDSARKVNANVAKLEQKVKHVHFAVKYEKESKELTDKIDARQETKRTAIADAKIPVPGISFGEGELLLNGVPFAQASTAEKLRTAFAIIVATNPKVRLAWIRDASLLDDESLKIVNDLAHEYDCQVLLETVRATGKNAIVLEDGMVKVPDTEAVAA